MSTDPNLIAALLQNPDLAEAQSQQPVSEFMGGMGRGLYNQYVQPLVSAGQAAGRYAQDPIQTTLDAAQAYQQLPQRYGEFTQNLGEMVKHPGQTADVALEALRQKTSTPGGAGELASNFLPGPGEIARGISGAEDLSKLGIWGGPKSPAYDTDKAGKALQMKLAGAGDREIYDATFDEKLGGGYWVPPKEWGQQKPWFWSDDRGAKLQPGVLTEAREEGERQYQDAIQRLRDNLPIWNGEKWTQLSSGGRQNALQTLTSSTPEKMGRQGEMSMRNFLSDIRNVEHTPYTMSDIIRPGWKGFDAYPGLRDQPLYITPWSTEQGQFVDRYGHRTNYAHGMPAGTASFGNIYDERPNAQLNEKNLVDTLLHEVGTHSVSDFEQMPQGGGLGQGMMWEQNLKNILDPQSQLSQQLGPLNPTDRALALHLQGNVAAAGAPDPLQAIFGTRGDPKMQRYLNLAGEANARVPGSVLARQAYLESQDAMGRVYPFERYRTTGTTVSPENMLVRGQQQFYPQPVPFSDKGVTMWHPMYHPEASGAMPQIITSQHLTPIEGRDITQRTTPQQLALGLRRTAQRRPK